MGEKQRRPFAQILSGGAADDDAFAGGGHTRTAAALADTICQIKTRDGAIGLEGSWGAGKSMVITLAAKALPKGKYDIFTFDLWRHQTDNFRRLFLEEFVSWLDQRKYLTTGEVTQAISRIRDRTQTIGTDRFSLYTWPGLIFLVLLALAPIGYSLLTADTTLVIEKNDAVLLGLSWPQIVTILVPLIFVAWVVLRAFKLTWNPEWRRGSADRSLLYALSETAMIFSNEKKRETIEQNIRDEDPTAFEFYGLFRDLLTKAQKDGRRVVFVLDNIDRLPRDEVRAAWSQIWAVFSPNPSQVQGPAAHVTAVVPYDRGHVLSAFNGPSGESAPATELSDTAARNDPNIDLFEKTFDRVIRVSPPVTSDWRAFLDAKLEQAFGEQISGEEHRDDRYHLYRMLQVSLREKNLMATPRRIISFVNEVGALWVQWGHTIPIPSIGFYVLHREVIEANPTVIAKGIFEQQALAHLSPSWTDHLAALCFNVEPSHARQVLLAEPIAKALTSKDAGDLKELKVASGFETTLYEVLASEADQWARGKTTNLSGAATNLEAVELEDGTAKNCWNMLADSLAELGVFDPRTAGALGGLYKIIEHVDATRSIKSAKFLRDYLSPADPTNRLGPSEWVVAITALFDALEKAAGHEACLAFQQDTKLPDEAGYCVNVAAALRSTNYQFSDLNCSAKPSAMVDALKQSATDAPNITRVAIPQLAQLLRPHQAKLIAPLVEVIAGMLRTPSDVLDKGLGDRLGILIELFAIAKFQKDVRATIKSLVDDGTLLWHAFTAGKSSVPTAADGVWLIVNFVDTARHTPSEAHPYLGSNTEAIAWYENIRTSDNEDQSFVDELINVVIARGSFSDWVENAIAGNNAPLFVRVLKGLIAKGGYSIDPYFGWMNDYGRLRDSIGPNSAASLLGALAGTNIDWTKAFDDDDIVSLSTELVHEIAVASAGQAPSDILKVVDDKLASMSEEEWLMALSTSAKPVGLLIARLQDADIALPPATFGEAIRMHSLEICVEITRGEYREDWPQLCKALPAANLQSISLEILNGLAKTTPTPIGVSHYIEIYRPIAMKMPFDKNPDAAVGAFLYKLAISPSEPALEFVRERQKDVKQCLDKASPDTATALDNTLNGQLRGDDEALLDRIRTMRDLLGFEQLADEASVRKSA